MHKTCKFYSTHIVNIKFLMCTRVAVSDTFKEMSRSTSSLVFLVCLSMCVWLSSLTAQSTTDQYQCDEGNARQVVLMGHMISLMQSMNDLQLALMEQLQSIDRRLEESNEGEDTDIYFFDDSSGDTTHARTHILTHL